MSKPFKCTSCGGPLEYEEGGGPTVRCPFCDNNIIVPEELRMRPAASWGEGLMDGIFKMQQRAANLQEVARLARSGRKIEAIKLYREIFGTGLEESKIAVERMAAGGPAEAVVVTSDAHPFQAHGIQAQQLAHHARRSGISWIVLIIVVAIFISVGLAIKSVISRINNAIPASVFPTSSRSSGSSSETSAPGFASVALKFGSEGIGPGMFKDARNIGVDGEGRIYVGEYLGGGRIQVFDASGKYLTEWRVDPKMPMRALAADRKGTVYVTQRGEVSRFEGATGSALGKLAYSGDSSRAYFDNALSSTPTGLYAIVNDEDIVRFDGQGRIARTISKPISAQTGDPERINALAVDGLGNIYALSGHDEVYKFSPEGRFLNKFGGSGEETGQLRAPDAIAVDGQGRVYVSDVKGIQVFDSNGRYLDAFKLPGHVAFGMVFNDKNELIVAAREQVIKFTLNK